MTKMTIKERQENLMNWSIAAPDILTPILEKRRPKMFFHRHYMKDGEGQYHCYCEKCGVEYDTASIYRGGTCSHCGNSNTLSNASEYNVFVQYNPSGWTATRYDVHYYQEDSVESLTPFEALKRPVVTNLHIMSILRYDKDYGFLMLSSRYWHGEKKFSKFGSHAYQSNLYSFTHSLNAFDDSGKHVNMENLVKQAEAEWAATQAKNVKPAHTKAQQEEEMRRTYVPKERSASQLIQDIDDILYMRYTDMGEKAIYKMACLYCNTVFESEMQEGVVCPHCGRAHTLAKHYNHDVQSYRLLVFENTDLPDEDLLLRVYEGVCRLERVSGQYIITRSCSEAVRFFLGKKKYAYDVKGAAITKIKAEFSPYAHNNNYMYRQKSMHTKEELRNIIANSYLRYSGAIEAMGLGNPAYKPVVEMNELAYIKAWYTNKAIEYIYKSQLRALTYECMSWSMPKLRPGTSIKEVLDISNMGLQIVRECDLGVTDMQAVRRLCKHDPTMSVDGYRQLIESINPTEAAELAENYGIRWKEMVDYLEAVYMHQCIEKEEAVTVWRDYLNMAKDLGYALNEKSRKFPNSLRKEHDIVVFATNALAEQEAKEEFLQHAQENHDRYHFTYDKLMAIVPQTTEDVVQEATQQHNCLRSYIRSIQNGSTAVAFIRRKDTPDKSYVTVEIRDSQIMQIQGFANRSPRCPELTEFLQHWTKAKKLKISCMY